MDRVTPRLDLDALEAAEKAATPGPWYLVGEPWASGRFCETYAVAGGRDPHGRSAVLQWVEVDEVIADDEDGLAQAAELAEATQRANLAIAVAARNALPALIARARLAERMAEALRKLALEESVRGENEDGEGFIECASCGGSAWGDSMDGEDHLKHCVFAVLREWDALNAEKGGET